MVHIIHPMDIHHASLESLDISVRTILRVSAGHVTRFMSSAT